MIKKVIYKFIIHFFYDRVKLKKKNKEKKERKKKLNQKLVFI